MENRVCFSLALLLSCVPVVASGADTAVNGTTIIRIEQRSAPGFDKQNIAPATQFLSIESTGLADRNLSLHLGGWGRVDLGDKSTTDSSDTSLNYAYLRYLFPKANAEIKAGRFFVFEGVSTENLDGLYLKTGLAKGFSLSAYGGAPVRPPSSVDNRGDYLVGGRLGFSLPSILDIGLSGQYEKGLDSGPTDDRRDKRELVGGDLWLKPLSFADLKGRISYDTVNNGVADQTWLLAFRTGTAATLALEYSQYEFKEYFAASAIKSLFNPDQKGGQKNAGATVTFRPVQPLELSLAYRHTDRDDTGNADRFGGQGRLNLFDDKGMAGFSYYRVNAPSGINSYHEARCFLLYNAAKFSASVDGIINLYDDDINGKDKGFEIQSSAGYRLMPGVQLSGDISYAENPSYTSEVKGLVRLTVNYNSATGAAK